MTAGDFFSVPPGHDSWVVGSEEYTSLHFLGADRYTRRAGNAGDAGLTAARPRNQHTAPLLS